MWKEAAKVYIEIEEAVEDKLGCGGTYWLVRSWQLLVWSLDYAFILWQDWCPISQSSNSNSRQIYKMLGGYAVWQVRIIGK